MTAGLPEQRAALAAGPAYQGCFVKRWCDDCSVPARLAIERTRPRVFKVKRRAMLAAGLLTAAGAAQAGPIEDLQPGHWYEIPNSRLSAVLPSPVPPGNTGPESIMDTWNGGAYDSKRDRLIVWGGGHMDYAGNELYVFDMTTFRWTRLTNPSSNVSGQGPYYADGQPRSRHTYEVQEYIPDPVDRFCAWGNSSTYPQSNYFSNVDCFDFDTNTWSLRTNVPSIDYGGITAYDADRGLLIHHSTAQGRPSVYNWATDTWRSGSREGEFVSYELTADYDPVRKQLVGVGGGGSGPDVYIWNVSNPNSPGSMQGLQTTGHDGVINILNPGVAWDPVLKRIVIWGNGPNVYSLDRDTNVWQKHAPAPTNTVNPGQRASNGTFGRFRYMPRFNAYVVVNSINANVFVYKLTANSGVVTPTVNLTANPTSVPPQGSTELNWSSTNADTCAASDGWTGSKPTSGTETVGPLASSTTFTLSCQNSTGGSAGRSVTVTLVGSDPLPTVDLSADPTTVDLNATTQLMWTSSNASSCVANGGWSGPRGTQGSEQSGPLAAQTEFTLTCSGAGGSTPDSVTVNVTSSPPPPPPPTTKDDSGGGGALDLHALAALALTFLMFRRRWRQLRAHPFASSQRRGAQ